MESSLNPKPEVSLQSLWSQCMAHVRANISEQDYLQWFQPVTPDNLSNGVLTLRIPTHAYYDTIENNYVHLLRDVIDRVLGPNGQLEYRLAASRPEMASATKGVTYGLSNGVQYGPTAFAAAYDTGLNPQYTLDNFVEGSCNRLAYAAGMAVAENPDRATYNPLLFYGGVGMGKTHLVNAIGNRIKAKDANKFVLYTSSESFTTQFVNYIKTNRAQEFLEYYLQVDVLIIDDIQFLAGKERTQEMFFNIFNHLHQNRKRIILTSDCTPAELKGITDRLKSRFKMGLIADIQAPDFETRLAIIQMKMQQDGLEIGDEVVEYLAKTVDTNIRELEGVLISLAAQAQLSGGNFDLTKAKQIVQSIVSDVDRDIDIDHIQKLVSSYFAIPTESLKDKTRKKEIVVPRQVAMYFAREWTKNSLERIGEAFGGRDHTTVLHAITTVKNYMDTDEGFKYKINELTAMIRHNKS